MKVIVQKAIVVAGVALVAASPMVVDFVKGWEGRAQFVVYADKLAGGLPTVCAGLTKAVTDTPIVVGERWAPEKCEVEEQKALHTLQLRLAQCFTLPPTQHVFDAATSHAWNFGVGATCSSMAMQAWNLGEWALGCRRLADSDSGKAVWSYVKTGKMLSSGKHEMRFVQGLRNRRLAEVDVCLNGWPS